MRTATKIKYLKKARDLISDKDRWCQGSFAKDKGGHPVSSNDRKAYSFCTVGVINKVCPKDRIDWRLNAQRLKELLMNHLPDGYYSIINLNDEKKPHTHRRVIGTFNRAIKSLESEL